MRTGFFKQKSNWLWLLYALVAVLLCLRNFLLPSDAFDSHYTHYNNFVIFQQSFFHLLHGQDLYISYPSDHFDLYKYTPTFALLFGSIAWMPAWLGLALWNLVNVMVLVTAIKKLPCISDQNKLIFGLLLIQETVTSTMNSQSNVLIAGLLVLAWVHLENGSFTKAVLFIACTAFIKIFGILFFLLFLFYPGWKKAVLPSVIIFILLFILPVPVAGFDGLIAQYKSYLHLLANDHGEFVKYSVMGWMQSWFRISPPKNAIIFSGLILQIIPLILYLFKPKNDSNIKALFSASLLIWLVIFNHMAESATFVIAVTGVLIWFFYSDLPKVWKMGFLIPVIVFTCFGPSDIFPKELRHKIVEDWQLKVFPCILVWAVCLGEMVMNKFTPKHI